MDQTGRPAAGLSMLSIGKLGPGQAQYYLDQAQGPVSAVSGVSSGAEDYYAGTVSRRGSGSDAARSLGLSGECEAERPRAVLEGRHPERPGCPRELSPAST